MKIEIKMLKLLGIILLFSPFVIIIVATSLYGLEQALLTLSIPLIGLVVIALCMAGIWISDEADMCAGSPRQPAHKKA